MSSFFLPSLLVNPGNPTGCVYNFEELEGIAEFCRSEGLVLIADEVYQANVYLKEKKFHSMKKVVRMLGPRFNDFQLISFHSTSKGILGECGKRGGFMEVCGFDSTALGLLTKLAASTNICPNVDGQIMSYLMVSPPSKSDDIYDVFKVEKQAAFDALKTKSLKLQETLDAIPGISCQPIAGALYAFPKICLPKKAIEAAAELEVEPDTFYCLSLLRNTGICCVPGSAFGQENGTYHIRITFLPNGEEFLQALVSFKRHHLRFIEKHK